MNGQFPGSKMQQRAIYPSRFLPHIAVLVGIKSFRSFGIYLSYDLLKLFHVVQFLFFIKAGSSLILLFLQKPFSSGRRLSKNQWFRVFRHAFIGGSINLLWLFGLTLCGPFRSLLLYEHSDMVIIATVSALFTSGGTPSRMRGAVFMLLAVIGILFFDHDDVESHHTGEHHDVQRHESFITDLFDHITNLTGLSDHKGGVALLVLALCANVGYNTAAKKLSVDVGGSKRLHTLSTLATAVLLAPWAFVITMSHESPVESWLYTIFPLFLVIVIFVGDFYIEAVCTQKLEAHRTCCIGAIAIFVSGFCLSIFWDHPFVTSITTMSRLKDIISEDHVLSGGVVFSFVLFLFATQILTSPVKGSKGNLIGYSAAGLPLYNFAGDALQRTSQSIYTVAKNGLRQILEESDSRKIFYFLCVNLAFTFVELIWGAWTNSLGLISDGFHMLFDCSALVMGLYASIMSRWKATRIFSYGYDRVEILSGFVNGLFLMVIACFVFLAALGRIIDPPDIRTEKLLVVSVVGLLVNLVGIIAFRHAHTHGHGHSHGGSHGHSHAGHGHSHKGHGHSHNQVHQATHNTNMEGVFLHVLADTLGSVGVIISTLLIEYLDLKIADPVCSLFIATLIFISVIPLVKETAIILLLRTPEDTQSELSTSLKKLLDLDGVISYREDHFWRHSSRVICGTLHVQVQPNISEQKIVPQITSIFKEIGITNLTVQVEKETYFQHISGLGVSLDQVYEMTKDFKTLNYEHTASFINAI